MCLSDMECTLKCFINIMRSGQNFNGSSSDIKKCNFQNWIILLCWGSDNYCICPDISNASVLFYIAIQTIPLVGCTFICLKFFCLFFCRLKSGLKECSLEFSQQALYISVIILELFRNGLTSKTKIKMSYSVLQICIPLHYHR